MFRSSEPSIIGVIVIILFAIAMLWVLHCVIRNEPIFPRARKEYFQRKRDKKEKRDQKRARLSRPSQFVTHRKNETETLYELPNVVTIIARTNLVTRQVSFEWEFRSRPANRKVEFDYTNTLAAISMSEKLLAGPDDLADTIALLIEGAYTLKKMQKAEAQEGEIGAAKHFLQPFAAKNTGLKGYVEKVLPEGLWYIKVHLETDDIDEEFIHTANLENTVREAARLVQTKSADRLSEERLVEEIKAAVDSVKSIEEAVRAFAGIDARIDGDATLSPGQKQLLKKENQVKREQIIRRLRA